eukprot:SAG11_NODE_3527_length_2392_cov_1.501962_2_plen_51_part_00
MYACCNGHVELADYLIGLRIEPANQSLTDSVRASQYEPHHGSCKVNLCQV